MPIKWFDIHRNAVVFTPGVYSEWAARYYCTSLRYSFRPPTPSLFTTHLSNLDVNGQAHFLGGRLGLELTWDIEGEISRVQLAEFEKQV
ncbi:hypothetical protein AVEN_93504-1 [Araneus ventricosus]|uniref:Uncharacterized protein n=1 Tax=Araneus ventricosus TaxID=182803 RepID=A0A4Y2AP95_ARAVE|nr:hypothetical protein AVEN_93504-1 [Araneus ventricosus]